MANITVAHDEQLTLEQDAKFIQQALGGKNAVLYVGNVIINQAPPDMDVMDAIAMILDKLSDVRQKPETINEMIFRVAVQKFISYSGIADYLGMTNRQVAHQLSKYGLYLQKEKL